MGEGLRHEGQCSAVFHPSFGMLDIDWTDRVVRLQIRNDTDGTVAYGHDGAVMEVAINLDTCMRL